MSVDHAAYAAAATDPDVLARIEGRLLRPEDPAGCWSWDGTHNNNKGRAQVWVHGRYLLVYRVLWVAANHGETPEQLDHVVCADYGCVNPSHLRPATNAENGQHRRGAQANNLSSGVRGVCWNKQARKWQAHVRLGGRMRGLGFYAELADAARAARVGRRLGMPFSAEDQCVTRAEVLAAYRIASPTVRRHFDELAEIGAAAFVSVHRVPA